MKRRGVTVVEWIVVMVIILILAAILVPVFNRYPERGSCQSHLRQIGLGLAQYTRDYDARLPRAVLGGIRFGWADAVLPYVKSHSTYHCPTLTGHKDYTTQTNPKNLNYTDYWLNSNVSALRLEKIAAPSKTISMGDGNDGYDTTTARYSLKRLPPAWTTTEGSPALRHPDGLNLLFVDGHVKPYPPQKIVASPRNGPSFALR